MTALGLFKQISQPPVLVQCWASVADAGSTLNQHPLTVVSDGYMCTGANAGRGNVSMQGFLFTISNSIWEVNRCQQIIVSQVYDYSARHDFCVNNSQRLPKHNSIGQMLNKYDFRSHHFHLVLVVVGGNYIFTWSHLFFPGGWSSHRIDVKVLSFILLHVGCQAGLLTVLAEYDTMVLLILYAKPLRRPFWIQGTYYSDGGIFCPTHELTFFVDV